MYNSSETSVIYSNQVINAVAVWVHGDSNVSLVSMESIPGMPKYERGETGRSGNCSDATRMEPPGPIRGKVPQGDGRSSCNIFSQGNIFTPYLGYLIFPIGDLRGTMKRVMRLKRAKAISKTLEARTLKFCFKRLPPTRKTLK